MAGWLAVDHWHPQKHAQLSHAACRQTDAARPLHSRDCLRRTQTSSGLGTLASPISRQCLRPHPLVPRRLRSQASSPDMATNILELYVDAVWASVFELRRQVRITMIESRIELK